MSKDKKHREHAAGKGDAFRKVNKKEFDKTFDRIWPDKKEKKAAPLE